MSDAGLWLTLAALGAYHGLNPAMGWLFAVSQGMQQRERRAVLRALAPIAIGHELSIVLVAGLVLGAAAVIEPRALHVGAAAVLLAFGIFRFVKPRAHPRWTTMRVNRRELALWSFLMSTAHGAGLMVAPLLIGLQGAEAAAAHGHDELGLVADVPLLSAGLGIAVHVAAMLLVMAIVAVVVYEKLGLRVLSRAWVNTDGIWAATFVMAAGITFFT
ncbi:MAG: hypothetical protein QOG94_1440 [Solirubrobacteraceae bacterium]|nr:hypothetical protein [Solirubrobacteraceae bacterium]MEA2137410.1 hypothetical protein [Solirubrobacteraceae bacterium]